LLNPAGKTIDHGVILKVVTTNICGSDQHMVRGRTTAPRTRDHRRSDREGPDVEYLEIGDLVSVPFNVACGPLPDLSRRRHPRLP
jgi:glutathione-independent formaldehyde dehydrogenase